MRETVRSVTTRVKKALSLAEWEDWLSTQISLLAHERLREKHFVNNWFGYQENTSICTTECIICCLRKPSPIPSQNILMTHDMYRAIPK